MMERIEIFLVVIVILMIIALAGEILSNFLLIRIVGPKAVGQITLFNKGVVLVILTSKSLVCLCVAFWLYSIAKQYGSNRWGWFIFGLFFGVLALVVFYLVRIHDMIETKFSKGKETSETGGLHPGR